VNLLDERDPLLAATRTRFRQNDGAGEVVACWLFEKEGTLQKLIHGLKYDGMTDVGVALGRRAGRVLRPRWQGSEPTLIVPVPLHRSRRRERGYNQAEYICRGFSSALQVPVSTEVLLRGRYTSSQTHLDHAERAENVRGAFEVPARASSRLKGARVLLVDDVMTTGATMSEASRALHEGGAAAVTACALALADLKAGV
jgi:ComF family protein